MRIGILADIHGHIKYLELALAQLTQAGVDRIILLGDVIVGPQNADETVALLEAHRAVGVWGNHELGLCIRPGPEIRASYTQQVVEFFSRLDSLFEIENLLFSHCFPSQDAADPLTYYLGPNLEEPGAANASFASFTHRISFLGHFHRWFVTTPTLRVIWEGNAPLKLDSDQRYLVVVHAVMFGWFAIFDDATNILTPCQIIR